MRRRRPLGPKSDVPGPSSGLGQPGPDGCGPSARRASLWAPFVKLHLVDCPHGALNVLHTHETFVERQVVSHCVLPNKSYTQIKQTSRNKTVLPHVQQNYVTKLIQYYNIMVRTYIPIYVVDRYCNSYSCT